MEPHFLQRCLELALRGGTAVMPNPRVGAVLVHQGSILAEGWHEHYGGPHAEVNCLNLVDDPQLLAASTLYVSLEPCSHHGKTPPCADLIIRKGIKHVVIGSEDPNPKVAGRGIKRLQESGIAVELADDPAPFRASNAAFWCNQLQQRPYITLKWAQTADGKMGTRGQRLHITGPEAQAFTHQLRASHQAILVGAGTALADQPSLATRSYPGSNPLRVVLDREGALIVQNFTLPGGGPSLLLTRLGAPHLPQGFVPMPTGMQVHQALHAYPHAHWLLPSLPLELWDDLSLLFAALYTQLGIGSILVEGGALLAQAMLQASLYDQLFVLQAPSTAPEGDVLAPNLPPTVALHYHGQLGHDQLLASFAPTQKPLV